MRSSQKARAKLMRDLLIRGWKRLCKLLPWASLGYIVFVTLFLNWWNQRLIHPFPLQDDGITKLRGEYRDVETALLLWGSWLYPLGVYVICSFIRAFRQHYPNDIVRMVISVIAAGIGIGGIVGAYLLGISPVAWILFLALLIYFIVYGISLVYRMIFGGFGN